ncbi:START domain-containing protein [Paramicrosporidium saccamoebae]|uniref:START domain-containing protein n=1 Tax=Paramicrosporidium saccamoebae TaxID=1246581 RepID=A0A2H9TQM0_9FUNG|nr:START domain-containing protein [Paramicrosporidium saccamoebae]
MARLFWIPFAVLAMLPLLYAYLMDKPPIPRTYYLGYLIVQVLVIAALRHSRVRRSRSLTRKRARTMPTQFDVLEQEFFALKPLFGVRGKGWTEVHGEPAQEGTALLKVHTDNTGRIRVNMCLPLDAVAAGSFLSQLTFDELCMQFQKTNESRHIYLRTRTVWPLAPRDCHLGIHAKTLSDGSLLCLGASVENKLPCDGVVRMKVKLAGALVVPISGANGNSTGHSELFAILDCDPCGFIPPTIQNALIGSLLPQYLRTLRDRMLTYRVLCQPSAGPTSNPTELLASLQSLNQRIDAVERRITRVDQRPFGYISWVPWLLSGSIAVYLLHTRRNRLAASL